MLTLRHTLLCCTIAAISAWGMIGCDRHYATDLAAGAIVGVTSGFVLPQLLHFGFDAGAPAHGTLVPWSEGDAVGIAFAWRETARPPASDPRTRRR